MKERRAQATVGAQVMRQRDPRPASESVAAVVVTYHPDPGLVERMRPLIGRVGALAVVDNGSNDLELASLDQLVRDGAVSVIRNGTNLGIAAALNQGFSWAEAQGYAWVLTLDQDTEPGPDVVSEAAKVFDAFPAPPPAVIGASSDVRDCDDVPGRPKECVITAGAVTSVAAWAAVGRFREDFFIDYVDIEFCLRARAHGLGVLICCRPTIRHSIGHPSRHRTRLRSFTSTNHDRVRRYYITRNRVHVWRAYWRREPRYVLFDMRAATKELVKLVLFETDRSAKIRGILRGSIDGLRGVTGIGPRRI